MSLSLYSIPQSIQSRFPLPLSQKKKKKLAHSLARHATNVSYYAVWIESVPPQFNAVFQVDLATVS